MFKLVIPAAVLSLIGAVSACAPRPQAEPAPPATEETTPLRTSVTDLDTFNAFIRTRPSPEALRAQYPGLTVVLPDDMATKEFRMDNSRYFVELDDDGRVTGGRFQ